jgi:hypothetical protein
MEQPRFHCNSTRYLCSCARFSAVLQVLQDPALAPKPVLLHALSYAL